MSSSAYTVRGELLRWAREQQRLSLRQVAQRGGPCPAHQSEFERGKKRETTSRMLEHWVKALNVTEAFARGQVFRYLEGPDRC
ncbi:MAG TPA: helix-turn-helix domain-containing protein, partial [Symbiobacteriaceae bacterium]|nr:helix-turn-helix domain-containing protein [Symbiobacteriaceae bacterium]